MKKIDIIHTTILVVAVLSAWSALQTLITLLSMIAYATNMYLYQAEGLETVASYLILIGLYSAACIVLVRNGMKYAHLLLANEPEASWDDAPKWDLDRRNILLVLFIGLGLYIMVEALPALLKEAWLQFTAKVDSGTFRQRQAPRTDLAIDLLRVTIGAFLVYASPTLTNLIEKNIAIRLDTSPHSE
jgi:hypothetical protein